MQLRAYPVLANSPVRLPAHRTWCAAPSLNSLNFCAADEAIRFQFSLSGARTRMQAHEIAAENYTHQGDENGNDT